MFYEKSDRKTLLITFLASLIFYFFVLPYYSGLIAGTSLDNSMWMTVYDWLSMCFHAVPAFCLQLLLCRKTRRWIAAIPGLAVIGLALWAAYGCVASTGWDTLGYAILMQLSAAPAVGCILAWSIYCGWELYQKICQ